MFHYLLRKFTRGLGFFIRTRYFAARRQWPMAAWCQSVWFPQLREFFVLFCSCLVSCLLLITSGMSSLTTQTAATTGGLPPSAISLPARLSSKKFFLTFPQCPVPKEDVLERLKSMRQELEWAVIGQERHQDGNFHLHLVFQFRRKLETRDMAVFDFLCPGHHPNIKVPRNVSATVRYCRKEDANPLLFGEVPQGLGQAAGKGGKNDFVALQLISGATIHSVTSDLPGFVLQNLRKMEQFGSFLERQTARASKKVWKKFTYRGTEASTSEIVAWLNLNLFLPRAFKQEQLYIYGPTNSRKSSLIRLLEEYCSVYHLPLQEEFCDDYEDNLYDLVVADEFNKQRSLQFLNSFVEGATCNIRKKGRQGYKKTNPPAIFLSNWSIAALYSYTEKETFNSRFQEVTILPDRPIDLDNIVECEVVPLDIDEVQPIPLSSVGVVLDNPQSVVPRSVVFSSNFVPRGLRVLSPLSCDETLLSEDDYPSSLSDDDI